MATSFTLSMKDAKSQPCSTTLPMTPMTAVNHDDIISDASLWADALLLVSDAVEYSNQMTHSITPNAAYSRPISGYANREAKVAFTIKGDTTGKLYTLEIPAPNLDKWPFNSEGKEVFDAPYTGLNADVQVFIDATEQMWEQNGEGGTVQRFRFVGRNL